MSDPILAKLFEHNNWANLEIIRVCSALADAQLDAPAQSATRGTIRETLMHLVDAQHWYLALLTLPAAPRHYPNLAMSNLAQVAEASGQGLLALARDPERLPKTWVETGDGYMDEPWVVMVQAINHATEHREQINSMLTALGVTPLSLDGWAYAVATGAEREKEP